MVDAGAEEQWKDLDNERDQGKLTVSRPRLMVPTNLEIVTVRDIMALNRPVRANKVDVETIVV